MTAYLDDDIGHAHARVGTAMPARLAEPLAPLLLEHPNLRPARFTVDDADDLRVGDKRRARQHLAAVLRQKQHLLEGDFLAGLRLDAVDRHDRPGVDLHLAPASLN